MRKRFLSILTALALALSLLPVTVLAAEGDGKITSDTATITQSGSYSIDSDVTLTNILTVEEGATVTLDLGGHTLSHAGDNVIVNNGTLTVRNGTIHMIGSGTYVNKSAIVNNGTMVLESGVTVKSDTGNAVTNAGGSLTTAADMEAVFNGGSTDKRGSGILITGGQVTMTGGTVKCMMYALTTNADKSDPNSTATVTGGTLQAYRTAIYWPIGNLTLGDQNGSGPNVEILKDNTKNPSGLGTPLEVAGGTVNIYGGTYKGISTTFYDSDQQWMTDEGANNLGDAITVYTRRAAAYGPLTMHISGGQFSSARNYAIRYLDLAKVDEGVDVNVTISGGSFTSAQDKESIHIAKNTSATVDTVISKPTVTGGTFSSDVSQYVPSGYTCEPENGVYQVSADTQLVVKPDGSAGDDTTSATLDGSFAVDDSGAVAGSGGASGEVADNTVTVTLPENEAATTATLNVTASTVQSLAANNGSLTVESGVGTLAVDNGALKAMAHNAASADVALSIKKTASEDETATYELTATAGEKDVFTPESAGGSVTITVPAPESITAANVKVYYLGPDGAELVEDATVENGNVVWTVEHFSTYFITGVPQTTSVTVTKDGESSTTTYADFGAALDALSMADGDVTVKLLDNVSMTKKATIGKSVTIDGGGYTITGDADVVEVCFEVTGGAFTIKNATLTDFGHEVNTTSGGVIAVPASAQDGVVVNASDLIFNNFNRAALDIRAGTLNATNCTINCQAEDVPEDVKTLTKGILVGMTNDTTPVKATIENCTINGVRTDYEGEWSASGIEVYGASDVTVKGTTINSTAGGISVARNYGKGASTVAVEDCTIEAADYAMRIFESNDSGETPVAGTSAQLTVSGGTYTGDVRISRSADAGKTYGAEDNGNDSKIAVNSGTFTTESVAKYAKDGSAKYEVSGDGKFSYYPTRQAAQEAAQADESLVITAVDLAANPDAETVTVKVDDGMGQAYSEKIASGSSFTLPAAPVREGYTFDGWYAGETRYDGSAVVENIAADVTFTAKWTEVTTPDDDDDDDDDDDTPGGGNGGGGGGGSVTRYEVSAPAADNGKVTVSPASASKGQTVTITVTPDEGYELASLTVTDKDGKAVTLTDKGDGKYTFTMPGGKVTVTARFRAVEPAPVVLPFTDVVQGAWYYDAVAYAYENGLMEGTGDTIFAPGMTTTRSMLATLLYRLEGEPAVSGAAVFTDVPAGTWCTDAVAWAAREGVVNGVGDGTAFAPDTPITREQMAVMLYRYAQYKGYDVSQGGMAAREYADYGQVAGWARYAMDWAVAAGLITGTSDTTLSPQGQATRAEIATILMRFAEKYVSAE